MGALHMTCQSTLPSPLFVQGEALLSEECQIQTRKNEFNNQQIRQQGQPPPPAGSINKLEL